MDKDGGSCCSICFGEYTATGSHRVTSLKCGHLFGVECIEKWITKYKKNYCPTCSTPFKKSQLRPIFATKIVAYERDLEKELIEKYIKENESKKALEVQVEMLKSYIEIIKHDNKTKTVILQADSLKIHTHMIRFCKIHFFTDSNKILFDPINQVILISCLKNGQYGIFKYCITDFTIFSFIDLPGKVYCMKISPFGDGLCLVACTNMMLLINIYSEDTVKSLAFEYLLTAVSFCKKDRNQVLISDITGNLYFVNILTYETTKYDICKENIHSLVEDGTTIYLASVFGIYTNTYERLDRPFEKEDVQINGVCCSLTIDLDGNVLGLFRNYGYCTSAFVFGNRNHFIDPNVKQYSKHDDMFFNGYILITDDCKNCIKVFDRNTLQMVYSYKFKEKLVGFCGDSNILAVLSQKGVYLYDSRV